MRVDYGNDKFNDLTERLRPKLLEFLIGNGVVPEGFDISKPFKCIAPDHEDTNPSMSFMPKSNGTRVRCWSCGKSADIFQAAVWLQGLPEDGPSWLNENVNVLAKMFNEPHEDYEPTPKELARAKIFKLYADAADVLVGLCLKNPDIGFQHTRKRGLKDEVCSDMGVGTVDFDTFVDTLQLYGSWDKDFILRNLPYQPDSTDDSMTHVYFGLDFITFTLRDHRGVVVGFDRRFVHYDHEDEKTNRKLGKSYPKKFLLPYKSEIFDPSTFLYGLDRAKERYWKVLDIVEGYFDVLSGIQAGHNCIVGCCGTSSLRTEHLKKLHEIEFREICLVMDSDDAGEKAMQKYLDNLCNNQTEMRVSFKYLGWDDDSIPVKSRDPDMFFRLYCKEDLSEYEKMPSHSSFAMSLSLEGKKGTAGEALARAQIPHIAGEVDPLRRGKMIDELAEKTRCDKADIRAAVDVILSGKSKNIAQEMTREIERSSYAPKDLLTAITKAQNKLGPLFGGSAELVTKRAAEATFHNAVDRFCSKKGALAGFRTDIPFMDNNFGGVQRGMFLAIPGNPNSGKSALIYYMVNGLLKNHVENIDLCIVLFSFDDSSAWSWAKLIAIQADLPIVWCAEPHKYIFHDQVLTRRYQDAQAFYRGLLKKNIWVFGGDIGANLTQMNKAIKNAQEYTGKHILVVVDSFNKMQGVDGMEGTTKFERNADGLHEFIYNGLSVITSAETLKSAQGKKPTMGDMKDTSKLSYNANAVIMVYNPLHELREKSAYFWVGNPPSNPEEYKKFAVVQTDVWKNKITEYKGSNVFQFFDYKGVFSEIDNIQGFMNVQNSLWSKHGSNNYMMSGKAKGNFFEQDGGSEFNIVF